MPSDAQEFCSRSPPAPNPAHRCFAAEHLTQAVYTLSVSPSVLSEAGISVWSAAGIYSLPGRVAGTE